MASAKEIRRLAKETLGVSKLRPGQLQAIEAVLDGHDTLAVMSTGYGKSAIYQLAGELLGEVQRYEGDRVVVLFESVGYRTLDLGLVTDQGLLQAT